MTKFKIIGAGLALLATFGAGWAAKGVLAERDRGKMAVAIEAQARAAYEAEAAADKKALTEREERLKNLTKANRDLSGKLREAYAKDPKARAWADTCLPDSVTCLLQ